jgi:hypothetical protein|tara:strand:- start:37 stop:888 length:852 start_codon:yes stop_codon:yes gene_type:complete
VWSRNKANLYIQDALADFHPNPKALPSPPRQHTMYKQKLMLTHLTGFGSGAGEIPNDVTSYDFDGTNDYLSMADHADWDFANGGDFTIEFFMRVPDGTPATDNTVFEFYQDGTNYIRIKFVSAGGFEYSVYQSSSTVASITSNNALISANTWHHVAICRDGDNYYWYVDGAEHQNAGSPDSDTPAAMAGTLFIGVKGDISGDLIGRLDEYRISNTARYPSGTPFTPTTSQFTSDANTPLLIHCGETIVSGTTGSGATFVDSGNTGHTVTEGGDAIRDTVIYKF